MNTKTLVFLVDVESQRILLAMKKQGFGAGKWNGVGGKVETGESIEDAAVREAREEIGVEINPLDLLSRGVISFSFEGKTELSQDVHVFFVEQWAGEPHESEEMNPAWYRFAAIPYERMWVDDRYWLPEAIAGKIITARFHFTTDGSTIVESEVRAD